MMMIARENHQNCGDFTVAAQPAASVRETDVSAI
jgi:hypothetical protein